MELNVLHLSMYICTFVLQFVYLSFFLGHILNKLVALTQYRKFISVSEV